MPRTSDITTYLKKEKLYNDNYIERVSWLDPLTFSKLVDMKEAVCIRARASFHSNGLPI